MSKHTTKTFAGEDAIENASAFGERDNADVMISGDWLLAHATGNCPMVYTFNQSAVNILNVKSFRKQIFVVIDGITRAITPSKSSKITLQYVA